MTKRGKGLKPADRKLATQTKGKKLTANQWQNSPQQDKFMELYMNPKSELFGNAYHSALAAGYKPSYAHKICAPTTLNEWIGHYRKQIELTPKHITQGLQDMYLNPSSYVDSRSPADSRLKALELMAKVSGMIDNKHQVTNIVVQPILGGESVRTKVENDPS
jgi:hypothetical protein